MNGECPHNEDRASCAAGCGDQEQEDECLRCGGDHSWCQSVRDDEYGPPPPAGQDTERLRDALRVHHPIMRSETGPFSGCRCGGVGLGQDVIAHVVTEIRRALDPGAPAVP